MYQARFKVGDVIKAVKAITLGQSISIYKVVEHKTDLSGYQTYNLLKLVDERGDIPFKVNSVESFACGVVDYMCEIDHTYKALSEFDDELAKLLGEDT
jgi:hypothetical protein